MKETTPAPRKNPALKLLGCLIKVPLGCMGFMLGGLVVVVLFLPPSLGNMLHGQLEEKFNRNLAGSLEFEELWIGSLYNDQRIEGAILSDPEGELILRGDLRAPELWSMRLGDGEHYGPIVLELEELNLVQDAEGVSNLERALTRKSKPKPSSRRKQDLNAQGINLDLPRAVSLKLSADHITWQRAGEAPVALADFELDLDLKRDGWQRRMEGEGRVRLPGAGGRAIEFQCRLDDLLKLEHSPWSVVFGGEQVPAELIGLLFGTTVDLAHIVGAEVDSVQLKLHGQTPSERRVDALLNDAGHRLDLRVRWEPEQGMLVADGGDLGASLSVPRNSPWAEEIMGSAIPLGQGFELGVRSEDLWMHFRDFQLPLDGDLERLQASCTFEAHDVSFAYLESLQNEFKLEGRERLEEELHLSLRDGVLIFDGLSLPAKATIIQLDGGLSLRDGRRKLLIKYKRFPELNLEGRREQLNWRRSEH